MESSLSSNVTQPNIEYFHYGDQTVITFAILLAIIMVVSLVGNILVLVSLSLNRGLRTHTNLLLANLAVADIIAVSNLPFSIITLNYGKWPYSHLLCIFNAFCVGLGLMVSIHTLMLISVHKFISITQPLSKKITSGKIILMMMLAWGWCIFFNLSSLIGWTDTIYRKGASQCGPTTPATILQKSHMITNTIINEAVPLTVMTYCYCRIFWEVRIHMKRLRRCSDVNIKDSFVQQKQIAVTLFVVLACFVLCWSPYFTYSSILAFCGSEAVPDILNPIAYIFGYMNSACNPIIYALRLPSFRHAFKEILCCSGWKKIMITAGTERMVVATSNKLKYAHQYTPQVLIVEKRACKRVTSYDKKILKKSKSHDPYTPMQLQPLVSNYDKKFLKKSKSHDPYTPMQLQPLAYMGTSYESDMEVSHTTLDSKYSHRPRRLTNEFLSCKRDSLESS